MLRNYLTTAINNLLKNKLYSAINIIGLAIGLAACLVIALYVRDQTSYDKQWKDSGRIYRVNYSKQLPGSERIKNATTPLPVMPALQEYFGDKIEQSTRTYAYIVIIDKGTAEFRDTMMFVDPDFIKMFQFKVLAGSMENTLADRSNIAISEEVARRHFGNRDPIGKVMTINFMSTKLPFKVTAVYRIPGNTILDEIPLFALLDYTNAPPSWRSWNPTLNYTYFKLKKGIDIQ
jgi:putative ABC transport system permease protein